MDLRELRFKRRISQWQLSLLSGVHQSRISLIENGFPAKDEEKKKIAKILNIASGDIEWESTVVHKTLVFGGSNA